MEWIGVLNGILVAIGLWQVGLCRKRGWLIGAFGQCCQIVYGFITGDWKLLTNVLAVLVYVWLFHRWRLLGWQTEQPPQKVKV